MRPAVLHVLSAAALLAASAAAAQPAVLVKSKPIQGTVADPLAELSGRNLRWIKEEASRQAAAPTDLYALELAMLTAMSDDLEKLARRKKLSFDEVSVMIMHQVITRAATELDRQVRTRRRAVADSGGQEDADLEMQALLKRKAGMLKLIEALGPRMTLNARLVAGH